MASRSSEKMASRIAELEKIVKEKNQRIAELEKIVQESTPLPKLTKVETFVS